MHHRWLGLVGLWVTVCLSEHSLASVLHAEDWARFRGPNGTGVSTEPASVPTEWSPTSHLKWKTALPGPGSSSPIVVGDKIFVTCWSGYGMSKGAQGRLGDLQRHLVCVSRSTGKILWDEHVPAVQPEETYQGMFAENGYASHTPTSDGERVYVFYGKTGALAYDLNGKKLWQRSLGTETDRRGWGSASSPVLYENLVIIPATAESEALVALDKLTGEEVWRQEASGFAGTWGTPVLVKNADRTELVMAVPGEIWAFNPQTGKMLWYCETNQSDSYCASVAAQNGIVYAMETRGGQTAAVRTGGKDNVTATNIVWQGRENARISTPVVIGGRLYLFSNGIATCLDADTGERIFQSRLPAGAGSSSATEEPPPADRGDSFGPPGGGRGMRGGRGGGRGGQDYASPVAANGKIYFQSRRGEMHVIEASDRFHSLAVNRVTADEEDFSATPAISQGEIYIRSNRFLYCVADK